MRSSLENGMSLDDLELDPDYSGTVRSYYNDPVQVNRVGDFFEFAGEGRHRVIAAQSAGVKIPVVIKGTYIIK